ncbi:MAG: TRAP transporter fused permease subunit, partial [Gemmatimonadota bacterium]
MNEPGPQSSSSGRSAIQILILAIAAGAAGFHLYAAGFGAFTALVQRPVHLALMSLLGFLGVGVMFGTRGGWAAESPLKKTVSAALAFGMVVSCVYLVTGHQELVNRVGAATPLDLTLGAMAVVALLELTRRATGWGLVTVALLAIVYGMAGPYLPGILAHRGYPLPRILETLYLSLDGIWGIPLGVSADFVYLFVLFGTVLEIAGGGALLITLAARVAGGLRGGPAITATVASAFMGSLSGSAVANVVTTGTLTIPVMKKAGFQPHFAAGIEAAASTAGQIMPPVMGAGAFILATWTNIPYLTVAVAAIIPAFLYYVALVMMIQFRAAKRGLDARSTDLERAAPVLPRIQLLLPVVVIVIALALGRSPMRAAFWGVASAVGVTFLRTETRLRAGQIRDLLITGAASTVQVAAACATAGIVVGIASLTGIGLRMSDLIVTLSGGQLPIALVLTAFASIILGMGLPTTAAYVVLAALGAPALVDLGVPLLAAHLFVFYFGCMSNVTPPVALAAFAAAGVAGANAMRTALTAVMLASAGFIVPFMFVYGPPLLMQGSVAEILIAVLTGTLGVTALAAAAMGYLRSELRWWERAVLAGAAIVLLVPEPITDLFGVGLMLLIFFRGGKMKRVALIAIAGLTTLAQAGCEAGDSDRFLSIGTGNIGGIYYPIGGALASRLSARDPDRQYTAEVTAASVENIKRMEQGQIDLALSMTTTIISAYEGGTEQFPQPVPNLRIVAPLWPNPVTVVVPPDSEIRSLHEIRGERVSVGAAGSGAEEFVRVLLGAYGITYDDIEERYLTINESTAAIRDRTIAIAIVPVAYPAAGIMEITTTGSAKLIPLEGPEIDALIRERPYLFATVTPAGAYRGVDADVPTIA